MKHTTPLLFVIGGLNAFALVGVLFFYPLELSLPVSFSQTVFLPHAEEVHKPVETSKTPELIFTGDVMMARNVEAYMVASGRSYPFQKLGDLFSDADLVVGNFESTVRNAQRIEETNVMNFDTTPGNVQALVDAGFTTLSLANNHADDFGQAVTDLTRSTITDYGLTPFGDPFASEDYVVRQEVSGVTFSFIGFHAFEEDPQSLVSAIQAEHEAGNVVIMFPHWGVEYASTPSSAQISAAHLFLDSGADIVIGAHPHVIQTVEVYKGKPIIYSLGNFLFDQDWSAATKLGLVLKAEVSEESVTLHFIPITIEKRQMFTASSEITKNVLENLGYPDGTLSLPRSF